jgi:RND family efflux transporter MFP subunit
MKDTAVVAVLLCVVLAGCARKTASLDADDQKPKADQQNTESSNTDPALHLDRAAQIRAQLKTVGLVPQEIGSNVVAYGRLEEDPSTSYVARAIVPGILHLPSGHLWPMLGQNLKAGEPFGALQPRLAPTDRINLTTQLETARAEISASQASVGAARAADERAKQLNADGKNVSDRAVQEAEARLQSEQARLKAATDTAQLLQAALQFNGQATGSQILIAERAGDVVEVLAQPEESVEQGAPILRLTRLDHLLARIDLPVGTPLSSAMNTVKILPSGYENQPPISGQRLGFAPITDPKTQTTSILFRLGAARFGLRPGLSVTAYLDVPGNSREALLIPQSAVVRYGGRSFVFLQTAPETFLRQEISIDQPVPDGYIVTTGLRKGDRIVTLGAETLLSEEFKSKLDTDEGS